MPVAQVALFGFGQSIFDLMQRYLPAQLFAGVVRPVMAARFARSGRFDEAEVLSNAALKANLILIGLAATTFVAGGSEMLHWISRGKYGEQAVVLLLTMCVLIALESWRHVLDQLSHTVERYGFLVFSNGLLGASLLLGIALLPRLGILALPLANCASLVVANCLVIWWLRRTGFRYRQNTKHTVSICCATLIGCGVGLLFSSLMDLWVSRVAISVTSYAAAAWLLVRPTSEERQILKLLVGRRRSGSEEAR